MNNFGIELDFLQVGDGERSGDAIALRYGNPWTGYDVMIVDGGNKASGEELVRHVTSAYQTWTVQHVVNKRRGARVYRTNGGLINFTINWPRRPEISDAPEIPFYDRVEA